MNWVWLKFSVAVLLTSAALVVALFATGAFMVGHALASGIPAAAQMHDHNNVNMPPELAGLKDIPPAERFAHFKGVQVNLTDQNGNPLNINVTPGVATNVSANSISMTGNDGATHTYTLDDQTLNRATTLSDGDKVVVVTIGNTSNARAVLSANPANWHHS
jgi:hypothetical protein